MAINPAKTPGPTIETSSKAQISEFTERVETMINKAIGRTKSLLGVVLLAAIKATGTAMIRAKIVPSVAMANVSHIGSQSWFM